MTDLCPGCATRYQDPSTGLCEECGKAKHDTFVSEIIARWFWTARARSFGERYRPCELPDESCEVLELIDGQLFAFARLRRLVSDAEAASIIDSLEESAKQIAYGPEECQSQKIQTYWSEADERLHERKNWKLSPQGRAKIIEGQRKRSKQERSSSARKAMVRTG